MARIHEGERFPDLVFHTAFQSNKSVYNVLRKKTVFWVQRYVGCMVCQYDIHLLCEKYSEFAERGVQVYVILQSDVEHVRQNWQEGDLPFEIICDEEHNFYRALEIVPAHSLDEMLGEHKACADQKLEEARTLGFVHGDFEGEELQLPAVFVVDTAGTVCYAHYARELTDMPSIDELLTWLSFDSSMF